MEFFNQFGLLFSNMEWYVIVCVVVGLVLLFVEMFQPGFGVFGITGFVLVALSVILRAIFHRPDDDVLMQVFQFLLFYLIIVGGAFILFLVANKKKWLKKTPFMQEETAVSPEYSDGTLDFTFLIGKNGRTVTDLRPVGKAEIEGKVYDVVAENFFIAERSDITVVATEGSKIQVNVNNEIKEAK